MKAIRTKPAFITAAVAVALALAAWGAISALATDPNEPCSGVNIHGEGSSLQKIPQEVWLLGFRDNVLGCVNTKKDVSFSPNGSAAGLEAWGVNKSGKKPEEKIDQFIATDDAPNEAQLLEIDKAALLPNSQALVIPVTQAAIAMIVDPPANCTVLGILNEPLQLVWAGEITLWNQIPTSEGTGCSNEIHRVVRKDGSGTTYQFKHYLLEIFGGKLTKAGNRTWHELQPETTANLEWPEESTVSRPTANGGSKEAELVSLDLGSIGYANLGDARPFLMHENFTWLAVQNENTKKLVLPGTETGEPTLTANEANCEKTHYSNKPTKAGPDDNWSEVYGGHPDANEKYPICTLTWDIGLLGYLEAGLSKGEAQTAHDYLNYVVNEKGGQQDLAGKDYRKVEETSAVGTFAEEEALLVEP